MFFGSFVGSEYYNITPHLSPVVVDGEVLPRVGVSVDLAVDGGADLLGSEDALLSLLDLLHDLGVVAQLAASFPEHLSYSMYVPYYTRNMI